MAKSYMKYELPVWTINYLSVFRGWFGETPLPSTHRKVIKLIKCKTCIRRNVTYRVSLCLCKYVCYFKEGNMHLIFFDCMLSMYQALK